MKILKLTELHVWQLANLMYLHAKSFLPNALQSVFTLHNEVHCHITRNRNNARIPNHRSSAVDRNFLHLGPVVWHKLPNTCSLKIAQTFKSFKLKTKKAVLRRYIEI